MPRRSPKRLGSSHAQMRGAKMRALRRQAGMTLKQLEFRSRIGTTTLSRLERGLYEMSMQQGERLASALGCQVTDFVIGSTPGESPEEPAEGW